MEVGPRLGAREEAPTKDKHFVPMVPAGVTPNMVKAMLTEALGEALAERDAKAVEQKQKARVPNERQRGSFRLKFSRDDLWAAMVAMEGVIVVSSRPDANDFQATQYFAYCADFDEIDEGDIAPEYALVFDVTPGAPIRRRFIRQK